MIKTELDIIKCRLQNQQIAHHQFTNPAEIVSCLGAVQAQDYAGAKWALGMRLKNSKDEVIEQALTDGKILRTHVMRPTWHFVSPKDIRWMLALTAPRINGGNASRYRGFELTEKALNKCHDVLIRSLEGGKQLTRNELSDIFNKTGIVTNDNRAAHILMHAELAALICSGARKGNQTTYALLDERVPKTENISADEALGELAERYFTSHGPATVHDFAWWSGLTLTDVKRGIAIAGKRLVSASVKPYEYWYDADMPGVKGLSSKIYLLPNYDEYIVGYADRKILAAASHINSRDNALFSNTVIAKGKVAGVWKRGFKKDTVVVESEVFPAIDKGQLQKSADRYGKFLGKKAIVTG